MKDMCVDFRKSRSDPKPVWIKGEVVGRVSTHKYLGVIFENNLCWNKTKIFWHQRFFAGHCSQCNSVQCPYLCCGLLGKEYF